jgi:segregation and condensation protein B
MSVDEPSLKLSLTASIEAILFVAVEPVSVGQLAEVLGITNKAVDSALIELAELLSVRGVRLQMHSGRVQLTTAPETSELIEGFLGLEAASRLSRAALETLAIIAYQQPVTRPQVDSIRGVNSDGVMKSLLGKGLIQEGGRTEGPGRPILYSTTSEFLQHFGLNSLKEMPPLQIEEKTQEDVALLKG